MDKDNYHPRHHLTCAVLKNINENANEAILALSFFLQALNKIDNHVSKWNLQGNSLEEALEETLMEIIDDKLVIHEVVLNKFIAQHNPIAQGLWNGNPEHSFSIQFVNWNEGTTWIDIRHGYDTQLYNKESMLGTMNSVLSEWTLRYFSIYFGGIVPGKATFPDRPAAGWMLYLPVVLEREDFKNAADIILVDNDKNKGSIIVSVDEFDPKDKRCFEISNQLEIDLVSKGALPYFEQLHQK